MLCCSQISCSDLCAGKRFLNSLKNYFIYLSHVVVGVFLHLIFVFVHC